ncbi:ATP-binding protein [Pelagicoccus sp. SDUM812003]|uniref:sensor histidine kinase n=1 Tax=Pelagicoccus sp. SDUM812003 TaxID=3041267 RepID=UPI00280DFDF1|nr:ATP-binding protein [Pelagicoccus sp. SDUM812003]MDQ8203989.1 ATP-binding protein [Pelagicoccus sp. SDUM812003]
MPFSTASRYTIVSSIIESEEDLATSRRVAYRISERLGLDEATQTRLATAVSELTRNALKVCRGGTIRFQIDIESEPQELVVCVHSDYPAEDGSAQTNGRTRSLREGSLGLKESRRLVSRLEVEEVKGRGGLIRLYVALPRTAQRLSLIDASGIREELLHTGELDPMAELKRQNHELLASLQLIETQKRELSRFNEELRRSEDKQRRTAEKLHAILENLPDSIVLYDPDGKFEYSNGPAKTLAEVSGSQVPFGLEPLLEQAIRTGKDYLPEGRESVLQEKVNGEDRYFLPRIISLLGTEDAFRGALLLLRDVTNLRLIDDLKSDLIGTVSHEIKGPVTSIRMAVLLLLDKTLGELNDDQQELAETAKSEIERLLRMLNNLLDVQRYSKGEFSLRRTHVSVSKLVETSVAEMSRDAGKRGVELVSEVQADIADLELFVDRERVNYALNNLLSNAIKYSETDGEVVVGARRVQGDCIQLSVTDDGPGIAREHQQLIFNRYAKAPGNRKAGVGLGLALAKEFVQLHGGVIRVQSELGRGSSFYIDLPIKSEQELLAEKNDD